MEKENQLLAALEMEQDVLRTQILNFGFTFDLPKRSFLKYLPGKKTRRFKIKKFVLNTMDHLADEKLSLSINMVKLDENPLNEKNLIIKQNNKLLSNIVAIALLNSEWKIKLFKKWLSRYINKRINPALLLDVCNGIDVMEDAGNFISSTVLMGGNSRTSTPKAEKIETNPPKAVVNQ